MDSITRSKAQYVRAIRCWKSFELKRCLNICELAVSELNKLPSSADVSPSQFQEISQLRQLVWFLKIKCLSEDHYVSEFLLLNDDDIEDEQEVRVISGLPSATSRLDTAKARATSVMRTGGSSRARKTTAGGLVIDSRQQTGIVMGRMSSVSSRRSSRSTTTSYRPLTTNMTATRTAFSRFTRPLLKYSANPFMSKAHFEYLYNTQTVASKCPDYRQCLEYLNMVRANLIERDQSDRKDSKLIDTSSYLEMDDKKTLGVFWLIAYGICYLKLRMNEQAEEYLKAAIELNPKHLDGYIWLVKIYLRCQQVNKVLAICKEALSHSKSALLFNWMARVQSMSGNLHGALKSLRQSLEYFPTDLEALANAGHFAFYADKHEQALKCFQRIQQMSKNAGNSSILMLKPSEGPSYDPGGCAETLNNLALCYLHCGFAHKVMPLFERALLCSSSKELTSDIWYNISFVPLSLGFKNLAIACLRLALKSNSENEEASNNLGVLKFQNELLSDGLPPPLSGDLQQEYELQNLDDCRQHEAKFDEAELHFSNSVGDKESDLTATELPEMLHNMALLKWRRGQLGEAARYCKIYLKSDENNHQIRRILHEIGELVMFDGLW